MNIFKSRESCWGRGLGSGLTGYSAELLGTPTAIAVNGLLLVTGALLLAVRPKLRGWETHPQLAAAPEAG